MTNPPDGEGNIAISKAYFRNYFKVLYVNENLLIGSLGFRFFSRTLDTKLANLKDIEKLLTFFTTSF